MTGHADCASSEKGATSDKVRLLLVSSEEVFNLGGVGMVVQRLIAGLPSKFAVGLASPDADSAQMPAALRQRLIETIRIPARKWTTSTAAEFVEHIRRAGYHLVNFHGGNRAFDTHLWWRSPLHALSKARIAWVNCIHCVSGFSTELHRPGAPLLLRAAKILLAYLSQSYVLARCRREVMVSRENADRFARWFPWVRQKLTVIYSARIEGEPPSHAFRDPPTTIGNLGHIAWRKGQYDLVRAFGILAPTFPQLNLVLVGPELDRDCGSQIRSEVARLGLQGRVKMPGGLTDLREFWENIDVYVQPSHSEGAPMSLMEALWHGKPAVGTRVSGIPEIIDDGETGLLVPPHDPIALAAAIERLLRSSENRRRYGQTGPRRMIAKKMTGPLMVEQYARLYEGLLNGARVRL